MQKSRQLPMTKISFIFQQHNFSQLSILKPFYENFSYSFETFFQKFTIRKSKKNFATILKVCQEKNAFWENFFLNDSIPGFNGTSPPRAFSAGPGLGDFQNHCSRQ